MRLTQKSLFKPTWEYEIADWKLVIRQKSLFKSHESVVPLQAIDPTPQSESGMTITYLLLALVLALPIAGLAVQAIIARDPGLLGFTVFFLPFFAYAIYKFGSTKYNNVVFDHYEGNAKFAFRVRRNIPSRAEFENFIDKLTAEAKKIRYRDDIPDDKKLEVIQRHLEYLQSVQVLSAMEVADLNARARKRLVEGKVSILNPSGSTPSARGDA